MRVSITTLLLLGIAFPAHGATQRSSARDSVVVDVDRVELAKITTIVGSTSGSVPVRLPHPAVVDLRTKTRRLSGPNPNIAIEGKGRFAGVVLTRDPYPGARTRGEFVAMGRFAECRKPSCDAENNVMNYVEGLAFGETRVTLTKGSYMLNLIADGAPVKITIRFLEGLRGSVAIHPEADAAVDLQTPQTRFTFEEGQTIWSAGSTYQAGEVGLSFSALFLRTPKLDGADVGVCRLRMSVPPPEALIHGPQCSALSQGFGSGVELTVPPLPKGEDFVLFVSFGYNNQGFSPPSLHDTQALGLWFRSPTEVEHFGSNAFFLKLD